MRLGGYTTLLKEDSQVCGLYGSITALERHRHRYEVNPKYIDVLEKNGLVFSGYHLRADETKLMEYIELPKHKFMVSTQSHPEFKSRLGNPSPLFYGFVKACSKSK